MRDTERLTQTEATVDGSILGLLADLGRNGSKATQDLEGGRPRNGGEETPDREG